MVIGSGPSASNASRSIIDAAERADGLYVCTINNAWRIIPREWIDWAQFSNDFDLFTDCAPSEEIFNKLHLKSWGYKTFFGRAEAQGAVYEPGERRSTVFLDVLEHITKFHPVIEEVQFIGCEHDYSGPTTHFYGNGQPDPLRFGDEFLLEHFGRFRRWAEQGNVKLTNLTGNTIGLLHRGMFA